MAAIPVAVRVAIPAALPREAENESYTLPRWFASPSGTQPSRERETSSNHRAQGYQEEREVKIYHGSLHDAGRVRTADPTQLSSRASAPARRRRSGGRRQVMRHSRPIIAVYGGRGIASMLLLVADDYRHFGAVGASFAFRMSADMSSSRPSASHRRVGRPNRVLARVMLYLRENRNFAFGNGEDVAGTTTRTCSAGSWSSRRGRPSLSRYDKP